MLKENNQKPKCQCASSLMSSDSPKLSFHKNPLFPNQIKKQVLQAEIQKAGKSNKNENNQKKTAETDNMNAAIIQYF